MAYVYRHIRLDKNEPFYIGIGSDINYKRSKQKTRRNNIWKKIASKCEYRIEILLDELTWNEACEKEIEFIKMYGRIDLKNGTLSNLTNGGDGSLGHLTSTETRLKISKSKIGTKLTNETKLKISISCTGKKVSDINKKRISDFFKGRPKSKESIQKMIDSKSSILKNGLKIVLDLNSGIYYDTSNQAADTYNISRSLLNKMLLGKRRNRTNLIYT